MYAVICRFPQADILFERRAMLASAYPGVASKARGRVENINVIMLSLLLLHFSLRRPFQLSAPYTREKRTTGEASRYAEYMKSARRVCYTLSGFQKFLKWYLAILLYL